MVSEIFHRHITQVTESLDALFLKVLRQHFNYALCGRFNSETRLKSDYVLVDLRGNRLTMMLVV